MLFDTLLEDFAPMNKDEKHDKKNEEEEDIDNKDTEEPHVCFRIVQWKET